MDEIIFAIIVVVILTLILTILFLFTIRRVNVLVRKNFIDKLQEYDCVLTPCGGIIRNPFEANDDEATRTDIDTMIIENHLAIGNFGGFPSITLPIGFDNGFPFGGNLTCKPYDEVTCLNLAYVLEKKLGYKNVTAKGGQN